MGRKPIRDIKRISELESRLRTLTQDLISGKMNADQYRICKKDLTKRITELRYGKS